MSADDISKFCYKPNDVEPSKKVKNQNMINRSNNSIDWALTLITVKIGLVFFVIMLIGFGWWGFELEKDVTIAYITSSLDLMRN